MKNIIIGCLALFALTVSSCSPIQVFTDYEKTANFEQYKTYAFSKESLDLLEISDIDKKRILRAIETEMTAKSFSKNEKPDFVIHIFTKSHQRVDVFQNNMGWGWGAGWGWGWGWGPGWGWGGTNVSTVTEGTLFIDFVDAKSKELVWQGSGIGVLSKNPDKKEQNIQEFVSRILEKYPPTKKK
jgi:hypothetical protein